MSILRKAAVAAGSTVLLTTVGAISGIGSSAAQAYTVSANPDVVVLSLTAADTTKLAASEDAVHTLCADLDGETTQISFIRPPTLGACELPLLWCARHTEGRPAALVFYWFSTECRY
jgi:hypothetical protein